MSAEAKSRLDSLKVQTDMVHMSTKWQARIKALSKEVAESIAAAQDFESLAPLLVMFSCCIFRSEAVRRSPVPVHEARCDRSRDYPLAIVGTHRSRPD